MAAFVSLTTLVTLGLVFVHQLTAWAASSSVEVLRQIADAHVAFNIVGTLLFLPYTAHVAAILERVLPGGSAGEMEHLVSAELRTMPRT